MFNNKYYLFFIIFFILSNSYAKQANVSNIRLSTNNNIERVVIETNEKVNFNAFILQKPNRLVVDLQNTNTAVKAEDFKANKIIDSIRIGKYSELDTRLVFDLNIKAKIIKSFYLNSSNENKNFRIVIDLEFNKNDLEKEDYIGKLIEENDLYQVEPNILNDIIDNILADSSKNNSNSNILNDLVDGILADDIETNKLNKQILSNAKIKSQINNNQQTNKSYSLPENKRKPRIIIDAGHGGKDPGTIGLRGTKEKIITLTYAKSLKDALEKTGKYKVYLTRNQDFFIELRERVSIARRYKGDLFISIHADSAQNNSARGLSIYTLSQNASDNRTAKLAQKENKADIIGGLNLYGEYQDTINTLVDISRRQAMNDSKRFSKILENELKKRNVEGLGEMRKYANFAVLTSADMPSILLELGFLSNRTDERMIRSFGYKTKIINSMISSINGYFNKDKK